MIILRSSFKLYKTSRSSFCCIVKSFKGNLNVYLSFFQTAKRCLYDDVLIHWSKSKSCSCFVICRHKLERRFQWHESAMKLQRQKDFVSRDLLHFYEHIYFLTLLSFVKLCYFLPKHSLFIYLLTFSLLLSFSFFL